jgi:tRNA-splicing ligase RtcB
MPHQREIADAIFQKVPVGVGAGGAIRVSEADINKALKFGVDWAIESGYAWQEDKKHCEEEGCMQEADPECVSGRAKKRGMPQLGSLGAGNHYIEVQSVAKVVDEKAAKMMGIYQGQICVMLHSGSRGLGHQICTDYLKKVEKAMSRDGITVNDRQLACAYLKSNEAQDYLKAMAAGANYAWVNRSGMSSWVREAFADVFKKDARDLEMHLLYDVCHNMAKKEQHTVNGQKKMLLVHRKGATRAMPRNHPLTPQDYQQCGQPVLVGGTMGSSSYILLGTDENLDYTFGSAVHGAGRSISRNRARRTINSANVFRHLEESGIVANVANPKLVQEEATKSYKPVEEVIQSSIDASLSRTVAQMRPLCVIKG